MTATVEGVTATKTKEPVLPAPLELEAAREMVRAAKAQGLSLTAPDGLLKALTKTVIEVSLDEEMTEHQGYLKHDPAGRESGNSRNGSRTKTVITDNAGPVQIEVPRADRRSLEDGHAASVDEPQRPTAHRHTHPAGRLSARQPLADQLEVTPASPLRASCSARTWASGTPWQEFATTSGNRPVYAAIFIDAVHVKIRDGQVANRPIYAAIGVTLSGGKDILGLWAGTGGEGAKFWMAVLTDLKNRGVTDTFFVVCDGLKGLPEVIGNVWPGAIVQQCVLHCADVRVMPMWSAVCPWRGESALLRSA